MREAFRLGFVRRKGLHSNNTLLLVDVSDREDFRRESVWIVDREDQNDFYTVCLDSSETAVFEGCQKE